MPWRRLLEPILGTGRRRGRSLVEYAGRDRHHFEVPGDTPPIFLAHGGDDIISDPAHSAVMYKALKRAGVPAELHIYAGAAHDFGVRKSDKPCSTWTDSCAVWLAHQRFLKTQLRP